LSFKFLLIVINLNMRKLLFPSLMMVASLVMAQKNADADKYAKLIKGSYLKEKLSIIASDDFEGRETAMPGQKKAAAYIEAQFKKFGLKPGNGDNYQQVFPVYRDSLVATKLTINGKDFKLDKDYTTSIESILNKITAIKEIVFVGYGLPNDYNNLDVKNKMVLFLSGAPEGYKPPKGQELNIRRGPTSRFAKTNTARNKEAIGVIEITTTFPQKMASPLKGNMYVTKTESSFASISASVEIASALLGKGSNLTIEDLIALEKGIYPTDAELIVEKNTENFQSSNVIGLLEGTDKKEEYVVLSAHYDHLGKKGNVIYYGADDDGSGTTSVLQMAEAFSKAKQKGNGPRRSIIFMTVSGEEKGLWGSEYYSDHPLFPLEKTTVDLNTDMVGRVGSEYKGDTNNYVYVIGEDKLSTDLIKITDSINRTAKLELDRRYNDLNDPNRFYYRSDHFNFAKKGVPIIFYFDGVHADYHTPTDTVDKINFDLMQKRVRLIFTTAWVMANREEMLKRDIPLNIPAR